MTIQIERFRLVTFCIGTGISCIVKGEFIFFEKVQTVNDMEDVEGDGVSKFGVRLFIFTK